jgi:hypothetical protein
MTKTNQAKIIAALQAELAAAEATKALTAEMVGADEIFYAAIDRISALRDQIEIASISRRKGYICPNTAALVAANID